MIDTILATVVNGAGTCTTAGIAFNPTCFLAAAPDIWFPIFMLIITMVIGFIVIIYALSPLLGRNDIRTWARIKIYEVLLTVLLAVIFLAISTMLFTVDPTPVLSSTGLLPQTCNPSVANNPSSANVHNIYAVSTCDMYQFNQQVVSFSNGVFWFSLIAGLAPQTGINNEVLKGGAASLPSGPGASGNLPGFGFSVTLDFMPVQVVLQYVVPIIGAYFAAVILAQVQELLLASSMIIFSTFMIIGFVARAFGVTKTFGGSMIAFALGFGFVYPLVTMISYGFLVGAISNALNLQCTAAGVATLSSQCSIPGLMVLSASGLLSYIPHYILNDIPSPTANTNTISDLLTPLIETGGLVSAGLLLIPMLNLVIVDAFIVDMSRAIGDRMDLMSLLTRIV